MSKKPEPQSGRVAYDDRGQPVWEWRVDTGVFSRDVDTKQVRQIQEAASAKLQDVPSPRSVGFDPYSTAVAKEPPPQPQPSKPQPPKTRRTLDDMRQLSEEIKRNRQRK